MNCTERDADLQAFLDGEIESSRALDFRRHLERCASCQNRLQFFQDLRTELRTQAAASKAPPHLKAQIGRRIHELERRRHHSWIIAAASAAIALCISLGGLYWHLATPRGLPLLAELAHAHAAVVRGDMPLAYRAADVQSVERWLERRLSFRLALPQAAWGGFRLQGASVLSIANEEAALVLFGKDGSKVSLIGIPQPESVPHNGTPVDIDGTRFWVFAHGIYTLVLWSEHKLLYGMVSDEEADETLEYARLCASQMRSPT